MVSFSNYGQTSSQWPVADSGVIAIGADANPLLNYIGNFFNEENDSLMNQFPGNGMSIHGKYFKDQHHATRILFSLNALNTKENEWIQAFDTELNPIEGEFVRDRNITERFALTLGFGKEKRYGTKKIQGVYGWIQSFSFQSESEKLLIGNPLIFYIDQVIQYKSGMQFSAETNLFAGVEWFVSKEVSLSLEFSWGAYYSTVPAGTEIVVKFNEFARPIEYLQPSGNQYSSLGIDNNVMSDLILFIYF